MQFKRKTIVAGILSFVLLFASACNKNQAVVKDLDGTWIVSSWTADGEENIVAGESSGTFNFTKCKVKKGNCDATLAVNLTGSPTTILNLTYRIYEKGEMIDLDYVQIEGVDGADDLLGAIITKQTETEFSFNGTDSDGAFNIIQLTKQ